MFNCGICGKPSKPKQKAERLVLETRQVTYSNGGHGTENVEEVLAHPACAAEYKTKQETSAAA